MTGGPLKDWPGIANGEATVLEKHAARTGHDLPDDLRAEMGKPGQEAWLRGVVDLAVTGGRLDVTQTPEQVEEAGAVFAVAEWLMGRLFPTKLIQPRAKGT